MLNYQHVSFPPVVCLLNLLHIHYIFVIHLTTVFISTTLIFFLGTLIILRLNSYSLSPTNKFVFSPLQFSSVFLPLHILKLFNTSLIQMTALSQTICVLIYNSICFAFLPFSYLHFYLSLHCSL